MANYNSSYTGSQIDNAVGKVVANAGTAGQVLTADGSGGSSWQNASGGGAHLYMHNIQINWTLQSSTYKDYVTFKILSSDSQVYTEQEVINNIAKAISYTQYTKGGSSPSGVFPVYFVDHNSSDFYVKYFYNNSINTDTVTSPHSVLDQVWQIL